MVAARLCKITDYRANSMLTGLRLSRRLDLKPGRIIQELNLKPEFSNKSPLMVTLDVRFHFGKSQIP